jgi:phosphate uptake regulator
MKRTLIAQGKGGVTLYLPKKWVDNQELVAGDEVSLQIRDEGILITSDQIKQKELSVDLSLYEEDIFSLLSHSYRQGVDKLIFQNCDVDKQSQIKKLLPKLVGFSISNQTENELTIVSLSSITDAEYDILLRRIFFLIKETINNLTIKNIMRS